MRVYEVRLRVDASNLTTVLDVIKDSADLLSMTQVAEEAPEKKHRVRPPQKSRPNGVSVQSIVMGALQVGPRALESLEKAVVESGFAKTSARVAANELARHNRIRKVGDGIYEKI